MYSVYLGSGYGALWGSFGGLMFARFSFLFWTLFPALVASVVELIGLSSMFYRWLCFAGKTPPSSLGYWVSACHVHAKTCCYPSWVCSEVGVWGLPRLAFMVGVRSIRLHIQAGLLSGPWPQAGLLAVLHSYMGVSCALQQLCGQAESLAVFLGRVVPLVGMPCWAGFWAGFCHHPSWSGVSGSALDSSKGQFCSAKLQEFLVGLQLHCVLWSGGDTDCALGSWAGAAGLAFTIHRLGMLLLSNKVAGWASVKRLPPVSCSWGARGCSLCRSLLSFLSGQGPNLY